MMLRKRRSLDSGSSVGEGPCSVDMVDRFGDLPDEVIHHIFSDLGVQELGRFCCVSKRWRELCLSSPSVNFSGFYRGLVMDMTVEMPCELRLDRLMRLRDGLDSFLVSRGDNVMKSFRLQWSHWRVYCDEEDDERFYCDEDISFILSWIREAVRCKVEKLDLSVSYSDFDAELVAFPSCVFRSASLRYLVVEMPNTVFSTPSFTFSSNLTKLDLTSVVTEDEGFWKWISSSCKSLKEICLTDCEMDDVIIESSSLEKFRFCNSIIFETCHVNISCEKLEELYINCSDSHSCTELKVVAPNVKRLLLEGNVKNVLNMGKLESLIEAAILMEPIVDEFDKVFEVLSSLYSVKVLVLNEATIKAAYKDEKIQVQLEEIWYLQIKIGSFTDDLVSAVVQLLRGTPKLCALYIQYKPTTLDPKYDTFGFSMEKWKIQNLDFISEIEDVTIELSAGYNGIELARYILEHAESLVKMVIRYLPEQSNDIRKLKESKMVSNPVVIFEEYESDCKELCCSLD